MVVPQESATLGFPAETRVALNGNHLTIAKFSSRIAFNFRTITTELHQLVTAIINSGEHEPATPDNP